MTARPNFRQIASPLDVPDAALEKLNDELGVPSLVNPASRKLETVGNVTQDARAPSPAPSPAPPKEKRSTGARKPARSHRDVRMAVDVPEYLRDAVNVRAATERCTARHIVMQGLQALGFQIEPGDLVVDGRQQVSRR